MQSYNRELKCLLYALGISQDVKMLMRCFCTSVLIVIKRISTQKSALYVCSWIIIEMCAERPRTDCTVYPLFQSWTVWIIQLWNIDGALCKKARNEGNCIFIARNNWTRIQLPRWNRSMALNTHNIALQENVHPNEVLLFHKALRNEFLTWARIDTRPAHANVCFIDCRIWICFLALLISYNVDATHLNNLARTPCKTVQGPSNTP